MAKMSRPGSSARAREERLLREAAELHIKLGQIQRYCELMVGVGEVRRHIVIRFGTQLHLRWSRYPALDPVLVLT